MAPGREIRAQRGVGALLLATVLLGGLQLVWVDGASAQSRGAAPRPNVVMIQTDDQTAESLRVMPNVRRLIARQGVTFDNSFVSLALCCPSRATLLTGQYAHNHGVLANHGPEGGYYKLDNRNTLPVWLRRSGYFTAMVGKYLNEYGARNPREVPPGWSEWYVRSGRPTYFDYPVNHNGRLLTFGNAPSDYSSDNVTRASVAVLRQRARSRQPFFLWTAYLAPHGSAPQEREDFLGGLDAPLPAPRHRGRFRSVALPRPPSFNEGDVSDKPATVRELPSLSAETMAAITQGYRLQLESLLAVDEGVAAIVNALRVTGKLANTVIVFTSDNGFLNGEHRVPDGKLLAYEPSIRVPLVVRGPGIPRNQHRRQLVANIDLAPTVLQLARARPGRVIDGMSLLPLIRQPRLVPARALLLVSGEERKAVKFAGVRTQRYVYLEHANGERELYDLLRDRFQLANRSANRALAPVTAALARRLSALRTCRGAVCRAAPRGAR